MRLSMFWMWMQNYRISFVALICGVIFSLYLQAFITDEVFFSGDAGLKALMAKQLGSGRIHYDLQLDAAPWVKEIWAQGFYPFSPPFVISHAGKLYSIYPFTFPLATAPLYALFGNMGLYLLPLVSTWMIWCLFLWAGDRYKLHDGTVALGLIALIFTTPLTLYSGMYWEHNVSVMLAFAGVMLFLVPSFLSGSICSMVVSGCLLGLSTWFRPEQFALCGAVILVMLVSVRWHGIHKPLAIILSISGMIAAYILINLWIYELPLGPHSTLVLSEFSIVERVLSGLGTMSYLTRRFLIASVPLVFLPIVMLPWALELKKSEKRLEMAILAVLLLAVWLIVPFMVVNYGGKQIGPRFWLILVPMLLLMLTYGIDSIFKYHGRMLRCVVIGAFFVLGFMGTWHNTIQGSAIVVSHYKEMAAALQHLKISKEPVVIVDSHFATMELQAAFENKIFFQAADLDRLQELTSMLSARGIDQYIYISFPDGDKVDKFYIPNKEYSLIDSTQYEPFRFFHVSLNET